MIRLRSSSRREEKRENPSLSRGRESMPGVLSLVTVVASRQTKLKGAVAQTRYDGGTAQNPLRTIMVADPGHICSDPARGVHFSYTSNTMQGVPDSSPSRLFGDNDDASRTLSLRSLLRQKLPFVAEGKRIARDILKAVVHAWCGIQHLIQWLRKKKVDRTERVWHK